MNIFFYRTPCCPWYVIRGILLIIVLLLANLFLEGQIENFNFIKKRPQLQGISTDGNEIDDPCGCLNNASIIDQDADIGGDDGQIAALVAITGVGGASLNDSSLIFKVVEMTGGVDAFYIPPVSPTQTPGIPVPGGTKFIWNPISRHYELLFYHYDNLGYALTVQQYENGIAGIVSGIDHVCAYPNPFFNPSLKERYFQHEPAVILSGNTPEGLSADAISFTIDEVAVTQLNPAELSVGKHTVVMTWNGIAIGDKGSGTSTKPGQPGCIQKVQKVVEIIGSEKDISDTCKCLNSAFDLKHFRVNNGGVSVYSDFVDRRIERPLSSYPNPFYQWTNIKFSLERPALVHSILLDITGKNVRTLTKRRYNAGTHQLLWNGKNNAGAILPKGIYFSQLEVVPLDANDRIIRTGKLVKMQ